MHIWCNCKSPMYVLIVFVAVEWYQTVLVSKEPHFSDGQCQSVSLCILQRVCFALTVFMYFCWFNESENIFCAVNECLKWVEKQRFCVFIWFSENNICGVIVLRRYVKSETLRNESKLLTISLKMNQTKSSGVQINLYIDMICKQEQNT